MKIRALILHASVFSLLFGQVPLYAQANDNSDTQALKNRTDEARETLKERSAEARAQVEEELDEARAEKISKGCDKAKERIDNVKTRVAKFKSTYEGSYEKLTTRMDSLVVKLKAKNLDTTQLETDLALLDSLIAQAKADGLTYETLLNSAADYDCVNDPEGFYSLVKDLRFAHKLAISQMLKVKKFMRETIKPDIVDLRNQIGETSKETKETNENNEQSEG